MTIDLKAFFSDPKHLQSIDTHAEHLMRTLYYATRCTRVVGTSAFGSPLFCQNTAYGAAIQECDDHR